MGASEHAVEKYLQEYVKAAGGFTRKFTSFTARGVPDQIVFLPGQVVFVEVKTEDGVCSSAQIREQQRMHDMGVHVVTVFGKGGVDALMEDLGC